MPSLHDPVRGTDHAAGPSPAGSRRALLAYELDVELDGDVLADEEPAGLEGGVPGEAEVLAVDGGGGREPGAGAAPRIGRDAVELDVEGHRLGHAVDGEVAVERPAGAVAPHRGRAERPLRVVLDVEEVGAAEVLV